MLRRNLPPARKKQIKRVLLTRNLRAGDALADVVAQAAARGWFDCGDLVTKAIRRSQAFKLLSDEQRFALSWSVDQQTGCWQWLGSRKAVDGYGQVRYRKRNSNAHRVGYQIHVGPVPPGMTIDHLCRNKGCVNPAHMEPVTHAENTQRWAKTVTTCPQGHPRKFRQHDCPPCRREREKDRNARLTVQAIRSRGTAKVKLSDDDVGSMRQLRAEGLQVKDIADLFGVTAKYASAVIVGSRKRRQRYTGPTRAALRLLNSRAGDRCEFDGCGSDAHHTHHRRPRRLGGSLDPVVNLPANLLRLCAPHHEWIESNRQESLDMGLLLHSNEIPAEVPVALAYGVVYLADDGTYEEAA